MIELRAAIFAGLGFGVLFASFGMVFGLALARSSEPIYTHTTDAEMAACMVAMDAAEDALNDVEAWVEEMRGVWILDFEPTEVPDE